MPLSEEDVREILRLIDESPVEEIRAETGRFTLYALREGAVLVRPDGFIAWRARRAPEDGSAELAAALSRILAR